LGPERAKPLAFIGFSWLGLVFFLLVVLISAELGTLLYGAVRRLVLDLPPADAERRLTISRMLAGGVALVAGGMGVAALRSALAELVVHEVRVPLSRLPRALHGLTIAQITDLHIGPTIGRHFVERVVRETNALEPDVIAITGDLVDGSVAQLKDAVEPLAELRAKYGVYFVTGNHEYYSGYEQWIDEVARLGLRPLRNQRLEIGGLDLAGVNDLTGAGFADGPDFGAALDGRGTARPVVLLAHQPVMVHEAARHGVDLMLAGHTHGGQMQPFGLVVRAVQPVLSGWAEIDGTQLFVTNGAGFWGPPVRVGVPPQVTLVELRTR
jgi:predicted MPP superfamily phosphohydrolase